VTSLCTSGRIYIGNIQLTYPDLITYNGLYVQRPELETTDESGQRLPVYRHESRDLYLYHVGPPTGGVHAPHSGYWVVGPRHGSNANDDIRLSAPGGGEGVPEMTSLQWRVWDGAAQAWRAGGDGLRAVCVGADFVTCSSGKVRVSAGERSGAAGVHDGRMGVYNLVTLTHQLRPVYR
jgi:hypothetical protein